MINNRKIPFFALCLSLLMLGGCDIGDDNNPSPVPDARDRFLGSWNVNDETCGKGKYVVTISKDPSNSAQVLINNFAFSHAGDADTAIVAGNAVYLYQQRNTEGWQVQGSGNYNSKKEIDWNYSLLISGTLENCTATYVKAK